jgi:RNA polymerase sigma factor for flagellar operon FliA
MFQSLAVNSLSHSAHPTAPAPSTVRSKAERDALIREHMPLLKKVARIVFKTVGGGLCSVEDLEGYGALGLIEAASRFDPTLGPFGSFATYYVRHRIFDGIRTESWYSRYSSEKWTKLNARKLVTADATQLELIDRDLHRLATIRVFDFEALEDYGDPASATTSAEEQADARSLHSRLSLLPPAQRKIVELIYFEGLTVIEAGKRMGFGRQYTSALRLQALKTLRAHYGEPDNA